MTKAFQEAPVVVLAVEDEPLVRDLIRDALEEAGYQVEEASNGEEAIAKIERDEPSFRALVTDVHLPGGKSGWDVAHRARELHPELPVIYITGAAANEWAAHGVPNSILIAKPFVPAQIVTAVSQLLNTTTTPPAP